MGIAHSIPLWCSWSEELFADLLGAVTLGPAYVESLATYVAARIGGEDDLLRDDGEHPMPCLRPILQILVHLQLLESEAQSRSKDERRSKDGLPDGGLDQLRNDLARIAGQWFEYCEGQFADWPKRRPPGLAKLSLSSPHGIRSRLLKWGDYVQNPVSSVPFALIVEQVGAIATTFADEVLNCVPLYDDAAFQRTRTLAGAAATVASEVEKNAKTAVLAEQSGEAAPLAPQDFVHFLAAQWHQGVRIDLATRPLRKNWLAATQRGDESIGQATHGSTVGSGRARKQEPGQAGLEAAKTVIQQLLNQDNKPYAWWDRIERAWAAGKAPDEQTIEVADWLLKLSFAINAPLDCPGALAPKTVCWPGCVEPR
jgi:hypothetical protein